MKNDTTNNCQSIGRLIGMISHNAHTYFNHKFKNLPLGHAQVFTLHHLIHHDGISQKQLTQYTKLDKGSIASQLNYLEKNKFIIRKVSENDARIHHIFITEKTLEIKEELTTIFENWNNILMTDFSINDQAIIKKTLIRIAENAQDKIKEIKNDKK